jgi:endonuclease/exonuclease/phosphatase family metal-dependent hydrolase
VKVLSFNTYGAPLASNRNQRAQAIAEKILKIKPDVAMLQELAMPQSWKAVQEIMESNGYHTNQKRKLYGFGGLVIFTKEQNGDNSVFVKYKKQGSILTLWERMLPKGYRYLDHGGILFINTQLFSFYRYSNRELETHQSQLDQLSAFINKISKKKKLVIAGDFNRPPNTKRMKRFMKRLGIKNLLPNGKYTHSSNNLSWRFKSLNRSPINVVFNPKKSFGEKQIDYIFCRGFDGTKISQRVVFDRPYKINGSSQYLSDHFGILTEVN